MGRSGVQNMAQSCQKTWTLVDQVEEADVERQRSSEGCLACCRRGCLVGSNGALLTQGSSVLIFMVETVCLAVFVVFAERWGFLDTR